MRLRKPVVAIHHVDGYPDSVRVFTDSDALREFVSEPAVELANEYHVEYIRDSTEGYGYVSPSDLATSFTLLQAMRFWHWEIQNVGLDFGAITVHRVEWSDLYG